MPQAGIEPARFLGHGGLSPACLPVPSLRHWLAVFDSNEDSQVQSLLSYRLNERPIKMVSEERIELSRVSPAGFKSAAFACFATQRWCAARDLNPHPFKDQFLRLACLPFHQQRIYKMVGEEGIELSSHASEASGNGQTSPFLEMVG